jgi:TRAP-type uncharacterized transport system substrate-binding protein
MNRYILAVLSVMMVFVYNNDAHAQRFCGGVPKGNYYQNMAALASGNFHAPAPLVTNGSLDNLAIMDRGGCDAGPAQADAALYYKVMNGHDVNVRAVATVGKEYGHLVCNQYVAEEMGVVGRLMNISDFRNPKARNYTIAIGPEGSGGNVTYRIMMGLLPYLDPRNGGPQVNNTSEPTSANTLKTVKSTGSSRLDCLFVVSTPKSEGLNRVDDNGATLEMVGINDPALFNLRDRWGQPIYEMASIPPRFYRNLQNPKYAFFNQPVTTIAIPSVLFANNDWYARNPSYAQWIAAWSKNLNYTRY